MKEQNETKSSVKITINTENVRKAARMLGKKTGNVTLTRTEWLRQNAQQEQKTYLKKKNISVDKKQRSGIWIGISILLFLGISCIVGAILNIEDIVVFLLAC